MASNRFRDSNGFLLVKACPVSSFGIFEYSAGQLGLDGDPNRIVNVFRPEEAVSSPEAIASFKDIPLINDHEMLSGFNEDGDNVTAPEDYGIDGVMTSNVYYDSPWMRGDLKIFSREMQDSLSSGKKDLSLGYSCDFEVRPGVFQGQPYEVVQTNMRGNHIALVDVGRVPGAKVLDGLVFDHLSFDRPSKKEVNMKLKSKKTVDNAVEQLKALLPALQQYLSEEATEPAHQGGAGAAEGAAGAGAGAAAGAGEQDNGGVVDPNAAAAGAGAVDPNAAAAGGEASGGGELAALVTEAEALLGKLKAAMGGAGNDEGALNGEDETESAIREGGPSAVQQDAGEAGEAAAGGQSTDTTEQGQASAGPAAGKNATAGDAAIRGFYADLAAKSGLYNRLSEVVGAFDHASMDAAGVARYGVKALKLKAAAGQEMVALDAYLGGVERAKKDTKSRVQIAGKAADSAPRTDAMDAYLSGSKA